jgi:hypothetical protein
MAAGVLCLFLLEMGMTASRKLRDLKFAGSGFIFFGLLAPNLFATLGVLAAYTYACLTDTHFQPGTYVLFAALRGAASYITVPAVHRLAIPEASQPCLWPLTGCFRAARARCQLFVNVVSIVCKDQFTEVAAGARGWMLHEFRMSSVRISPTTCSSRR